MQRYLKGRKTVNLVNNKSQVIILMSEMYGETLSESRLKSYLWALEDISLEDLKTAFRRCTNDSSIYRLPTPAKIKDLAWPTLNSREDAIRILSLIKKAIKQFGHSNSDEAKAFLGDDNWAIVCRLGGWQNICTDPSYNLNDPIIYAQVRDATTGIVETQRKGIDYNTGISQLTTKQTNILDSATDKHLIK